MIADYAKIAFRSISHRKLRSWLTLIGILIGITAVVALISISLGMQNAIKDEFEEHLDKTKKENINMPPPLNHYNSRVFIIEKIPEEKFIKYEVNWIYSIP